MSKKDDIIEAQTAEIEELYLDIAILGSNTDDLRTKARDTFLTLNAQDDKILGVAGKAAKSAQLVLLGDLFGDLSEV